MYTAHSPTGQPQYNVCIVCNRLIFIQEYACAACTELIGGPIYEKPPAPDEAVGAVPRGYSNNDYKALYNVTTPNAGKYDMFRHAKIAEIREASKLPEGVMFRIQYEEWKKPEAVEDKQLLKHLFG